MRRSEWEIARNATLAGLLSLAIAVPLHYSPYGERYRQTQAVASLPESSPTPLPATPLTEAAIRLHRSQQLRANIITTSSGTPVHTNPSPETETPTTPSPTSTFIPAPTLEAIPRPAYSAYDGYYPTRRGFHVGSSSPTPTN